MVMELVLASSSVWRAQLSDPLLTTGHCCWQALGCLPAAEPGVCLHSPMRLEQRAKGAKGRSSHCRAGPTRPPWHDGNPRKQEALWILSSSSSHLFPQLCPAEDRLGARLHRDFDPEWEVQQPATSCSNFLSSGSELERQRQRHSCTLRHSSPLSSPSPSPVPFGSCLPTSEPDAGMCGEARFPASLLQRQHEKMPVCLQRASPAPEQSHSGQAAALSPL